MPDWNDLLAAGDQVTPDNLHEQKVRWFAEEVEKGELPFDLETTREMLAAAETGKISWEDAYKCCNEAFLRGIRMTMEASLASGVSPEDLGMTEISPGVYIMAIPE